MIRFQTDPTSGKAPLFIFFEGRRGVLKRQKPKCLLYFSRISKKEVTKMQQEVKAVNEFARRGRKS
jgi:hypothetical protein